MYGKPGMPAKPDALKLVEGNPGKRAINKNAPKFTDGFGPCPGPKSPELNAKGRALWKKFAPKLEEAGLAKYEHRQAWLYLCQNWGLAAEAFEWLRDHGSVNFTGPNGEVLPAMSTGAYRNVYLTYRQSLDMAMRIANEFGISGPLAAQKLVLDGAARPKSKSEEMRESLRPVGSDDAG